MRIEITRGLVLEAIAKPNQDPTGMLFPAGEYMAKLTSEGKIEIFNSGTYKAQFSFSQFRENLSLGLFVVLES